MSHFGFPGWLMFILIPPQMIYVRFGIGAGLITFARILGRVGISKDLNYEQNHLS